MTNQPVEAREQGVDERAPVHAFEVRITIGGNDWDYVLRSIEEVAEYIKTRQPDKVNLASGEWSGSHSVDCFMRDISPDDYRKELEAWRVRRIEACAALASQEKKS